MGEDGAHRARWGPGFQTIHVAGTKGKGSTVGFLAGILRASGYNTATYKSPHVHSVAERITCGPIPPDAAYDERGAHLDQPPTTPREDRRGNRADHPRRAG